MNDRLLELFQSLLSWSANETNIGILPGSIKQNNIWFDVLLKSKRLAFHGRGAALAAGQLASSCSAYKISPESIDFTGFFTFHAKTWNFAKNHFSDLE